ncbi:hypothetical protein SFRURICE_012149 [Spodoptera frugiperda]|nr:hypothetical protein SFRURICE_012149 [Spodoptera frugiperda]
MEGQINVLKDLQSVMSKALTNYKKSPKDRLTVEYIETRLELLENDWSLFKDTKSQLYKTYKLEDISQKVLPTFDQFKKFIESRFRALEFIEPNKVHQGSNIAHAHSPKAILATNTSSMLCDKDTCLKDKYIGVINDYLQLEHLRPVKEGDDKKDQAVYLPHHAVFILVKDIPSVMSLVGGMLKTKTE